MKRIISLTLSILLILTLTLSLCACGKSASPVEDFEYEFNDGTVTITGYIGTDLEIVVPDTIEERPVTVIGEKAFSGYDMTSIVIPEGVTTIEEDAFSSCSMLENITFPDSLKEIYNGSYSNGISYNIGLDDTKWYDNQAKGLLYIDNILVDYKGDTETMPTELTIKNGTKCIADSALRNSKNLANVKIPNSVTYIGSYAFEDCPNLISVNIPNSVTYIGYEAFIGCPNLKSMDIPESVEIIEEHALGYTSEYDYRSNWTSYKNIEDFEIHGAKDSSAEKYAEENNIIFYLQWWLLSST